MAPEIHRFAVAKYLFDVGPPVPGDKGSIGWSPGFLDSLFCSSDYSLLNFWTRGTRAQISQLSFDLNVNGGSYWKLSGHSHADSVAGGRASTIAAARRDLEANGISLANYEHLIVMLWSAGPTDSGALGTGGDALFDQAGTVAFYQHEIGHTLGFQHAFGPFVAPPNPYGSLYNDAYDLMGYTGQFAHPVTPPPGPAAQERVPAGAASFWASERRTSAAGLYRRFENFQNSPDVRLIDVNEDVTIYGLCTNTSPVLAVKDLGRGRTLCIEYRPATGDDSAVTPAVVFHTLGCNDVGSGRSEINPPWWEAALPPEVGQSAIVQRTTTTIKAVDPGVSVTVRLGWAAIPPDTARLQLPTAEVVDGTTSS